MERLANLKRAGLRSQAQTTVHADRILSDLDGLGAVADGIVQRLRADIPQVFDDRRDRRAGDRMDGAK